MFVQLLIAPLDLLRAATARLVRHRANRAALAEMSEMSDDRLCDLGITRQDLRRAHATALADDAMRRLRGGAHPG